VPTVTICTSPFATLAKRLSVSFGMPELPIVILEERLADRTLDEINVLAARALPSVVAGLTA
jgi:hypothetical protein